MYTVQLPWYNSSFYQQQPTANTEHQPQHQRIYTPLPSSPHRGQRQTTWLGPSSQLFRPFGLSPQKKEQSSTLLFSPKSFPPGVPACVTGWLAFSDLPPFGILGVCPWFASLSRGRGPDQITPAGRRCRRALPESGNF